MTWCVGWRTHGATYLIADSLLTGGQPKTPAKPATLLGQPISTGFPKHREDNGWKVTSIGPCATATAGLVYEAGMVNGWLYNNIQRGMDPEDAVRDAVARRTELDHEELELLVAYPSDEDAYLLSFNATRRMDWERHSYGDIVQIGSGSRCGGFASSFRRCLAAMPDADSETRLVAMLAAATQHTLIQGFDPVAQAVGGAFVGCAVTGSGIHWQPRIHYELYDHESSDPKALVVVDVSERRVFTCNLVTGEIVGVSNYWQPESMKETPNLEGLLQLGGDEAVQVIERCFKPAAVQYLVLINVRRPTVFILPVLGRCQTQWVHLSEQSGGLQRHYSDALLEKLGNPPPEGIVQLQLLR